MPQESDTLINDTLCPLFADKFVGGILVWHVIPSLRLLRRDLIDVHPLSSEPRHRCAKDLIPTLFVSLRILGQLALLTDLLLVRTGGNILLHWQREHSVQILHHFEGRFVNVSSKNWPSELCLISARHSLQWRRLSSQDTQTLSHINRFVSVANGCCIYPGNPRRLHFSLNIDWSPLWS